MAVAYHTHSFEIPTATNADVAAGTSTNKVVTPSALGSAAAKDEGDFATAAQGVLASTALQPGDAATPAQGSKADSAMQPAAYDPTSKGGDVFPYASKVEAAAATIPASRHTVYVDGLGPYSDSDTGSTDTFTSSGGSARTFYRKADVGVLRGTAAVKAGLRPDFLNRHRLRFEQFIPAGFPDGPAIIAAKGLDRLYQQGVVFDEQSGQIFRIFNANTGTDNTWAWIAVYDRNPATGALTYVSCFSAGGKYNEGAVIHRIGGVRYLDISMGTGTDQIGRYDITTLPTNRSRMSTSATFNSVPIKVQMAGFGSSFLIEDNTNPFTSFRRKYVHQRYDNSWNAKGPVVFGIETTGDDGDQYSAITELYAKSQGVSISADFIVHHVGGFYDTVAGDKPYSNQGVRICDTSGKLLSSATLPASKLSALISAQGHSPTRIETEGGFVTSDGRVYSYIMFRSGSSANQTITGCAVVEWIASSDDAINFATDASQPTSMPIVNGRLINDVDPSSGSKFTLTTLLDFMAGRDVPSVSFAAARYPAILDLAGAAFPAFSIVRIDMLDNFSWRIRAKNLTTEKEYQISGPSRVQTVRTVRDEGTFTPDLKIGGANTGITYSTRTGNWKIANGICTVSFRMDLSSKGALVGTVTLDPLPVQPVASEGTGVCVSQNMASLTGPVFANAQPGPVMALYHSGSTGRAILADTNLTNTSIIRGSLSYRME